jgi:hypothetical protein
MPTGVVISCRDGESAYCWGSGLQGLEAFSSKSGATTVICRGAFLQFGLIGWEGYDSGEAPGFWQLRPTKNCRSAKTRSFLIRCSPLSDSNQILLNKSRRGHTWPATSYAGPEASRKLSVINWISTWIRIRKSNLGRHEFGSASTLIYRGQF